MSAAVAGSVPAKVKFTAIASREQVPGKITRNRMLEMPDTAAGSRIPAK